MSLVADNISVEIFSIAIAGLLCFSVIVIVIIVAIKTIVNT